MKIDFYQLTNDEHRFADGCDLASELALEP